MGTVPPTELLRLWQLEDVTSEMAIGYLIQNQINLEKSLQASIKTSMRLQVELDRLITQSNVKTERGSPPRSNA